MVTKIWTTSSTVSRKADLKIAITQRDGGISAVAVTKAANRGTSVGSTQLGQLRLKQLTGSNNVIVHTFRSERTDSRSTP